MRSPIIRLLAVVFLASPWTLRVHAQTEPQAKVIHTVATNAADSLELRTLFTIFDANGFPIPKDDIQVDPHGQVQLLGTTSVPVDATIEAATTPLKIALLIDISGSMNPYIAQVKEAAIKFVQQVPPNAEIAVFSFSEDFLQVQEFTDKSKVDLVVNAIQDLSTMTPYTGDTCVYKAAFKALNSINASATEHPEERRAIVLFTDGKDKEMGGQNCGDMEESNVITEANLTDRLPIQIHTIGLCKDQQCSNIEKDKLDSLATSTYGFTESGQVGELDRVFTTILSGLDSQWIATANILPPAGENQQASLTFSAVIRGNATRLHLITDPFKSDRDYRVPQAMVELMGRTFNIEENVYNLTLRVTNPEEVGQIVVDAWDESGGSIVSQTIITQEIKSEMLIAQKTEDFKVGSSYCSRVVAKSTSQVPIKNDKGDEILGQICGNYQPKEKDPLDFEIKSVDVKGDTKALEIQLHNIRGSTEESLIYHGYLNQGSRPVQDIKRGFLQDSLITVPLPDEELERIRKGGGTLEYTLVLTIQEEGAESGPTKTSHLKLTPPRPVDFLEGVWQALQTPYILAGISIMVLTVISLLGILAVRARRKPDLPRPLQNPANHTIIKAGQLGNPPADLPEPGLNGGGFSAGSGAVIPNPAPTVISPQVQVRIRIVRTPGYSEESEKEKVIEHFPCVLGRHPEAGFVVAHDKTVSAWHAELTLRGSDVVITDCRSVNGTRVGPVRLHPGGSSVLGRHNEIGLGRTTELEIDLESLDDLRTQYGYEAKEVR
ncbi:MAG TPA: VWA domain-containing protein [Chloroflexia bacterium]|jgi:hypothetical protein